MAEEHERATVAVFEAISERSPAPWCGRLLRHGVRDLAVLADVMCDGRFVRARHELRTQKQGRKRDRSDAHNHGDGQATTEIHDRTIAQPLTCWHRIGRLSSNRVPNRVRRRPA